MAFVILVSLDNLLYQRMSYHVLAGQIAESNIVYVFQHLLCHIQSRFGIPRQILLGRVAGHNDLGTEADSG